MVKYSKNFERDYNWYLKYKNVFDFSGSLDNKTLVIESEKGLSAKECFYYRDSQGIIKKTKEPNLLSQIYKCKESINFHIKMWAETRAEGTLPMIDFKEIIKEYELLDWMIESVEKQKNKYYKIK